MNNIFHDKFLNHMFSFDEDFTRQIKSIILANCSRQFAFIPHKCIISNKWIWFNFGYKLPTSRTILKTCSNEQFGLKIFLLFDIFPSIIKEGWISEHSHTIELLKS